MVANRSRKYFQSLPRAFSPEEDFPDRLRLARNSQKDAKSISWTTERSQVRRIVVGGEILITALIIRIDVIIEMERRRRDKDTARETLDVNLL